MDPKTLVASGDIVDLKQAEHEDTDVLQPDTGPASGFVSFAAGPSSSVLDRARDLLRSRPS